LFWGHSGSVVYFWVGLSLQNGPRCLPRLGLPLGYRVRGLFRFANGPCKGYRLPQAKYPVAPAAFAIAGPRSLSSLASIRLTAAKLCHLKSPAMLGSQV